VSDLTAKRVTGEELSIVPRPDQQAPDVWLMIGNELHAMIPEGLRARVEAEARRVLAVGLLDLVEEGYFVIGPTQRRERPGHWEGPYSQTSTIVETRCRVARPEDLPYHKRTWDGKIEAPYTDERGWEDIRVAT
jgi:hypothetical protein